MVPAIGARPCYDSPSPSPAPPLLVLLDSELKLGAGILRAQVQGKTVKQCPPDSHSLIYEDRTGLCLSTSTSTSLSRLSLPHLTRPIPQARDGAQRAEQSRGHGEKKGARARSRTLRPLRFNARASERERTSPWWWWGGPPEDVPRTGDLALSLPRRGLLRLPLPSSRGPRGRHGHTRRPQDKGSSDCAVAPMAHVVARGATAVKPSPHSAVLGPFELIRARRPMSANLMRPFRGRAMGYGSLGRLTD